MSRNWLLSLRLELVPVPASRPKVGRWSTYYPAAYSDYMERAAAVLAPYRPAEPIDGPVFARFGFQIPWAPSHYRTGRNSHLLKASAPVVPISPRAGDSDNLEKSILDALVDAGILADDSLVLDWCGSKRYGATGLTIVQLERADPGADPFNVFSMSADD